MVYFHLVRCYGLGAGGTPGPLRYARALWVGVLYPASVYGLLTQLRAAKNTTQGAFDKAPLFWADSGIILQV